MQINDLKKKISLITYDAVIVLMAVILVALFYSGKEIRFTDVLLMVVVVLFVAYVLFQKSRFSKINEKYKILERKHEIALKDQEVSGRLLIRRDLELTRAVDELHRLDERKSEFVSVVAHQLRTPLTGIKWTLNLILSGDFGEINSEQKTFLLKAQEGNNRMISLINDMLVADRIGSSKFNNTPTPTQVEELVDNLFFDLMPQIQKRKTVVNIKRPEGPLPKVNIDSERIRAVFQNILENALKYTKEEGKIEIEYTLQDKFVLIRISDNGIGIPKDQEGKMFSRFFRAANAIRTETDGTGLGLFIAKGIIESHGGRIWFESEVGKGTTFYFTLPIVNLQS